MAIVKPSSVVANKVNNDNVYLLLLEIHFGEDIIRICRNTEDIYWNGQHWIAFPFAISDGRKDNKGTLPNLTIEVGNQTHFLEEYIEKNGGVNTEVILYVIHTANATAQDNSCDLEEHFTVRGTTVNENVVTFQLGNSYGTRSRRPYRRYLVQSCPFKYKGIECGCPLEYQDELDDNGKPIPCNRTLLDCQARNNSSRFGGFIGIPNTSNYL